MACLSAGIPGPRIPVLFDVRSSCFVTDMESRMTVTRALATVILGSLFLLCSGCDRRTGGLALSHSEPRNRAKEERIYDPIELENAVRIGMPASELRARLGDPQWIATIGGVESWHYALRPSSWHGTNATLLVIGAAIRITNAVVASIAYVYAQGLQGTSLPWTQEDIVDMGFYAVEGEQEAAAVFDEITGPGPGGAGPGAGLVLQKVKLLSARSAGPRRSIEDSQVVGRVRILLGKDAAERVKVFTRTNVGRKVLVMVNGVAVTVITVRMPIEVEEVEVDVASETEWLRLEEALGRH